MTAYAARTMISKPPMPVPNTQGNFACAVHFRRPLARSSAIDDRAAGARCACARVHVTTARPVSFRDLSAVSLSLWPVSGNGVVKDLLAGDRRDF